MCTVDQKCIQHHAPRPRIRPTSMNWGHPAYPCRSIHTLKKVIDNCFGQEYHASRNRDFKIWGHWERFGVVAIALPGESENNLMALMFTLHVKLI